MVLPSLPLKPDFSARSNENEWMDNPNADITDLQGAFKDIERVNRFLGGKNAMKSLLTSAVKNEVIQSKHHIIDMGSAGGDLSFFIANELAPLQINVTGIDLNDYAQTYANQHFSHNNLNFVCANVWDEKIYPARPFVIITALFLHHFTDNEIIRLLNFWKETKADAIIINDLHRTPLAYYGFRTLSALLNFSPMATFDGAVSVLSGFKQRELLRLINATGWNINLMRKSFPYRWEIILTQ
jgi:2-polyprenyl-3-methyl-5-hydroxy-6-metoxy-1,4-benzoquinol methylase